MDCCNHIHLHFEVFLMFVPGERGMNVSTPLVQWHIIPFGPCVQTTWQEDSKIVSELLQPAKT
jgi:hypothetical protein